MKILWLSDSPFICTGYATISVNVLNGLSDMGHECHFLAHNYLGQTLKPGSKFEDDRELKFTIHGAGREGYCKDIIMTKIRELKPDVFVVLLDTFMLYPWIMQQDFAPAKSIFYFPSDGEGGLPLRCEDILKKFNYSIAMAKFGQKQVKEVHNINASYIPHAVDTNVYFPMTKLQREELKAKWGLRGKFVVGSVYRNQGRKMADRMFKAFALFAQKHPDAILFCHSDPLDQAACFDSIELIKRLGIGNRVIFSGMNFYKGFDYRRMNEVYNLMDVFFLSTSGEGFGVPIIEAAACGIPSVVTDYTTTQELLIENGQCGIPVPISTEITGSWNVERGIMDIDKAVEAMEILYKEENLRKLFGEHGRTKVENLYSWNKVIPQWDKFLKEINEK
jgi:glycosyltransferase involved in cell wall biosynthesis